MSWSASSGGAGTLSLAVLLWAVGGCDVVSGLSEFEVSGSAGAGAGIDCEKETFGAGCPGSVGWALPIVSAGDVYVTAVVADASGRVYLGLALTADVMVASKLVSHVAGWDSAVVALEPDGTVAWLKGAVGTGEDRVTDLALSPDGDLLVAGYFFGDVDVAGAAMVDAELGGQDGFLVKLAANNGARRWAVQYGGAGPQVANAVAVDPVGHVYVVGDYQGAITFDDGGAGEVNAGDVNAFVDKRDAEGQELWHLALGDDQEQRLRSIAMTSEGSPVVVGDFGGTITFDVSASITAEDGRDLFVAELLSNGAGDSWSRVFPASGSQVGYTVAVGPADDIFLAGIFDAELQLDRPLSTNDPALFLASLASDGEPRWSQDFAGTRELPVLQRMLAIDGDANLLLTGSFEDDAFVGATLSSVPDADGVPSRDVFAASFDVDGTHRWTHPFGGPAEDIAGAVAVDGQGHALFVGGFHGTVDFDQGETFESIGGLNGYLLRIAP